MNKRDQLWAFLLRGETYPLGCFAPEEGASGGSGDSGGAGGGNAGGGGDAGKTFTQEQVNEFVSRRVNEVSKKFGDYDVIKAKAGQVDTLTKELDDLKHQLETRGKSDDEKQRLTIQRELERTRTDAEKFAKERDDAVKGRDEANIKLNSYIVQTNAADGLGKAKVIPSALTQATRLFVEETKATLEEDDKGGYRIVFQVGSNNFTDAKVAAEEWLKANPHFALHPGGGAGTPRASSGSGGRKLDDLSPSELIRLGVAQEFKD